MSSSNLTSKPALYGCAIAYELLQKIGADPQRYTDVDEDTHGLLRKPS